MNAAAQTPGLTRLSTGSVCLLDALRWLVFLLYVHWLIAGARRLAISLRDGVDAPDDYFLAVHFGTTDRSQILTRVTRALGRAVALETKLLAFRPTEHGFPIEDRRAIAAVITDICTELGIYRRKPTNRRPARRVPAPGRTVWAGFKPAPTTLARIQRTATAATGPPGLHRGARRDENQNAGVHWRFSRRAPASFLPFVSSW